MNGCIVNPNSGGVGTKKVLGIAVLSPTYAIHLKRDVISRIECNE